MLDSIEFSQLTPRANPCAGRGTCKDKRLPVEMPYVFPLTDLPKLDIQVDRGAHFEAWMAQWTSYSTLSGLADQSAATKVQVLTLCLSRESLAIVNNLGLTEEQKQDATAIIAASKCHIDGQINESVERRNLRHRTQQAWRKLRRFFGRPSQIG